jgi:hypothetical protein
MGFIWKPHGGSSIRNLALHINTAYQIQQFQQTIQTTRKRFVLTSPVTSGSELLLLLYSIAPGMDLVKSKAGDCRSCRLAICLPAHEKTLLGSLQLKKIYNKRSQSFSSPLHSSPPSPEYINHRTRASPGHKASLDSPRTPRKALAFATASLAICLAIWQGWARQG